MDGSNLDDTSMSSLIHHRKPTTHVESRSEPEYIHRIGTWREIQGNGVLRTQHGNDIYQLTAAQ